MLQLYGKNSKEGLTSQSLYHCLETVRVMEPRETPLQGLPSIGVSIYLISPPLASIMGGVLV